MEPAQQEELRSKRPALADQPESLGKIRRLSHETRGLVDDIRSWAELRMTLTQMDVENRVDARINRAVVGAVVAALGLLGLTLALIAGALALGSVLGHDAWGFLVVAGCVFLVTMVLMVAKPRIVDISSRKGGRPDRKINDS